MYYAFAFTTLLLIAAVAFAFWQKKQKSNTVKRFVEPDQITIDDPILGQCVVYLPVVGQNQSKGTVQFNREIDDTTVEFKNTFVDKSGGTDGLDVAISELQMFFRLATDRERLKYYRNSLSGQQETHNLFFADSPLTEAELRSTAKLCSVAVIDTDLAFFEFSSPKFMHGRPISVSVKKNGEIEFVGN